MVCLDPLHPASCDGTSTSCGGLLRARDWSKDIPLEARISEQRALSPAPDLTRSDVDNMYQYFGADRGWAAEVKYRADNRLSGSQ